MKHLMIALVKLYRKFISPIKPPCCRFTPTCSAYALEAFEKRGFFAGLTLTLWRILRCSPFSPAGYDPVPQAGFRTMPLRFSKYDKYLAEQEAAEPFQEESDGMISPDSLSEAPEDDPSEDEA